VRSSSAILGLDASTWGSSGTCHVGIDHVWSMSSNCFRQDQSPRWVTHFTRYPLNQNCLSIPPAGVESGRESFLIDRALLEITGFIYSDLIARRSGTGIRISKLSKPALGHKRRSSAFLRSVLDASARTGKKRP
jgi:hypothetical protein